MDKKVLYRTVDELRQQCRFAQMAYQSLRLRLNDSIRRRYFWMHTPSSGMRS